MQQANNLVYPAVFLEEDEGYSVRIPDLNVATQGEDFGDALKMTQDVIGLALESSNEYPEASEPQNIELEEWENEDKVRIVYVTLNLVKYRKENGKVIRRNVSIPEYLNEMAKAQKINVSEVVTSALKEKLGE